MIIIKQWLEVEVEVHNLPFAFVTDIFFVGVAFQPSSLFQTAFHSIAGADFGGI